MDQEKAYKKIYKITEQTEQYHVIQQQKRQQTMQLHQKKQQDQYQTMQKKQIIQQTLQEREKIAVRRDHGQHLSCTCFATMTAIILLDADATHSNAYRNE